MKHLVEHAEDVMWDNRGIVKIWIMHWEFVLAFIFLCERSSLRWGSNACASHYAAPRWEKRYCTPLTLESAIKYGLKLLGEPGMREEVCSVPVLHFPTLWGPLRVSEGTLTDVNLRFVLPVHGQLGDILTVITTAYACFAQSLSARCSYAGLSDSKWDASASGQWTHKWINVINSIKQNERGKKRRLTPWTSIENLLAA